MRTTSTGTAGGAARLAAALLAGAVALGDPPVCAAQSEPAPVRPSKRVVRRPVIDLEKSATQVRPGQVIPAGEPAEEAPAPAAPPASATPPLVPAAAPSTVPSLAPSPSPTPRPPQPATDAREPAAAEAGAGAEPVKVVVLSAHGGEGEGPQAQWRVIDGLDGAWRPMETGARTEERVEIRTGLTGLVRVELDSAVVVTIDRLSRVRLERRARADASELSVELIRGRIEVRPTRTDELGQGVEPVRIRTPDAALLRRTAVSVTYDAFKGTRESMAAAR
jgi:hypothetical protein